MTTQPRTAAGRALLRNIRDYGSVVGTADQILAIEAKAAAPDAQAVDLLAALAERNIYSRGDLTALPLDEERLAEALYLAGFSREDVDRLADEYARPQRRRGGRDVRVPGKPPLASSDFARWLNGRVTLACGKNLHEICRGAISTLGIECPCLCDCHRKVSP